MLSFADKFTKVILLLLLIGPLSGCKNSAQIDSAENPTSISTGPADAADSNSDDLTSNTINSQEVVISSAADDITFLEDVPNYNISAGTFNFYSREFSGWDENSWSILSPSNDSRLIYVSDSSGDDETAEYYTPRDIIDIQNPGLIRPFKTIHAALAAAREGHPDWILLLGGDVWRVDKRIQLKAGRGIFERSVITAYGSNGLKPIIKSNASEMIRVWANKNFMAITHISFYAYERDPNSIDFIGWGAVDDTIGLRIYVPEGGLMGSILIEGNDFNFFSTGISITGGGALVDTVVRRNVVRNSYSEKIHSQGIYAANASMYVEENIFYHNGWYKQQVGSGNEKAEGQATMFNHNTYMPKANNTTFIENIFISSSSIHNKWTADSKSEDLYDSIQVKNIIIDRNIYIGGEIGISAGGNTDYDTGPRWENMEIKNNIMFSIGKDQPSNRELGWYIDASDWAGGIICGNYLLHNNNDDVSNLKGIELSGHSSRVSINNNFMIGLVNANTSPNAAAMLLTGDEFDDVNIQNNVIQMSNSRLRPIKVYSLDGLTFAQNTYFSDADDEYWFKIGTENYSFQSWLDKTGELGAQATKVPLTMPIRSIESYAAVNGMTLEEMISGMIHQSRSQRQRGYTVDAIFEYIENGYGTYSCE